MNTLEQVAGTIEQHQLLRPEERVLVAVSGGADSLCLAWTLRELGYQLHIAHIDHGLRPESSLEADFVRELAGRWGVQFHGKRFEPPAESLSSQEAWARQVRYQFLLRIATEESIGVVATGHTADDQVETILMNLIRGAGPDGLAGMPFTGPIPLPEADKDGQPVRLVRPLLELWREQTEACCQRAGLEPRQDATNLDLAFTRNRIRHQLLPQLAELNPSVKGALLRTSWLMRGLSTWIEQEIDQIWPQIVQPAEPAGFWLERQAISAMPAALAMSLLRRAHQRLSQQSVEMDFEHSQQALSLISEGDRGQSMSLPADLKLTIVDARALLAGETEEVLTNQAPQLDRSIELAIGSEEHLKAGWLITANKRRLSSEEIQSIILGRSQYDDPFVEAIRLPASSSHLELRPPRPGDEFQPLGMEGSMKLSDFFINEGVPQPQRKAWPLLVQGEQILWVVGVRLSESAKVSVNDREVLLLELLPPANLRRD